MSLEKNYHALIPGRIFMGAAVDVEAMVTNEGVEVVVDLRGEATECAFPGAHVTWVPIALDDHPVRPQADVYQKAIQAVTQAYAANQKVAFHCGGGKGRTGTVAAGVLLALGLHSTVEEAEKQAKDIRGIFDIKPLQKEALLTLYPND